MCNKNKVYRQSNEVAYCPSVTTFFLVKFQMLSICLLHYIFIFCLFTSAECGLKLNHLRAGTFNHRVKRDGGAIPFRPLFVYRQQQKEKQAKWKLEAEQKLAKQQYDLQNFQNSIAVYSKPPLNPTKSYYDYRPVFTTYQITPQYQASPVYQPYQSNLQAYPSNSYQIYSTFPYSYGVYVNQNQRLESYYDKDYSTSVTL